MRSLLWTSAATFLWAISHDLASSGVSAQHTNAACDQSYNWALNSLGQSPCLVAAFVATTCSTSNSGFLIPALPENDPLSTYSPPNASHPCQCSTGYYSLISACSDCQGHFITEWDFWKTNCTEIVTINKPGSLSGITGTVVPNWAYIDVTVQGRYNSTMAKAEAASAPPPSSSDGSTVTSSGTAATPDQSSDNSGSNGGSKSNTGAIAGGVVGGIVFLVLTTLGVWYLLRLHARNNANQRNRGAVIFGDSSSDHIPRPKMDMVGGNGSSYVSSFQAGPGSRNDGSAGYTSQGWTGTGVTQGHTHNRSLSSEATTRMIGSPEPGMQRFYDPDDPSTYPPPVDPSDVMSLRTTRTGYTGAAEV